MLVQGKFVFPEQTGSACFSSGVWRASRLLVALLLTRSGKDARRFCKEAVSTTLSPVGRQGFSVFFPKINPLKRSPS